MNSLKKLFVAGMFSSAFLFPSLYAADVYDEGYDYGYGEAYRWCVNHGDIATVQAPMSVTEEFIDGCRDGFQDAIDHNKTCVRYIRETEGAATSMWKARKKACS